jgi:hypothetical protein
MEQDSKKWLKNRSINYKPSLKKENINFKKNKNNKPTFVLPPIEKKDEPK